MDKTTVDLIETLRRIEARAKQAKENLAAGRAKNGAGALEQIRAEAFDAVFRHTDEKRKRVAA